MPTHSPEDTAIDTLLVDRVGIVRGAARFVFRAQPEIARQATSAYERRRRAAARRQKTQSKAHPPATPQSATPAATKAAG